MMYQFQVTIMGIWESWSGLFDSLPYGNPYIATATLLALAAMTSKLMISREQA